MVLCHLVLSHYLINIPNTYETLCRHKFCYDVDMPVVYYDMSEKSDWVKHRDSLWIQQRKRVYLYWFKFLQEAELSEEFEVDWKKYDGWGGSNYILGVKFDEFWEDRWKELFGVKVRSDKPKFPVSTKQPKTEGIRLALLCWQKRNSPSLRPNQSSNMTGIAKAVYEYEMGISGEKKERYSLGAFSAYELNPTPEKVKDKLGASGEYFDQRGVEDLSEEEEQREYAKQALKDLQNDIRKLVTRYLRNARRYMKNVSVGQFP